jgi:hypothetical protein
MLGLFISIPRIASPLFQGPVAHGSESQALREKHEATHFAQPPWNHLVMSTGLGEPHHTSISTVEIP